MEISKPGYLKQRIKLNPGFSTFHGYPALAETFDFQQIAELYHMRWGIETAYETLKNRLQTENFTGSKPILLLQDIYNTIYISNLAEDIIRDAEAELDEKEKTENIK